MGIAALWIGADLLRDAYGAGPPYYGGRVNMDKWTSPWPMLFAVVSLALVVIVPLLRPGGGRR